MVRVREDLTGRTFGRLTVIEQTEDYISQKTGAHYAQWLCECSCGNPNLITVSGNNLKRNHTTSCGCLQKWVQLSYSHSQHESSWGAEYEGYHSEKWMDGGKVNGY